MNNETVAMLYCGSLVLLQKQTPTRATSAMNAQTQPLEMTNTGRRNMQKPPKTQTPSQT
jgi:hypothetical protein